MSVAIRRRRPLVHIEPPEERRRQGHYAFLSFSSAFFALQMYAQDVSHSVKGVRERVRERVVLRQMEKRERMACLGD